MDADYIVVEQALPDRCVANRPSADPSVQVVVLEAGPRTRTELIHIPAACAEAVSQRGGLGLSDRAAEGNSTAREIYWPRGKTLGGSSSMNAMMWVRGFAADYDEWGSLAGDEWDYAHVEKYFTRIENGPLGDLAPAQSTQLTAAWLQAARECGYRVDIAQYCAAPEGFCEATVTQRKGARWSTADAYLKPALRTA